MMDLLTYGACQFSRTVKTVAGYQTTPSCAKKLVIGEKRPSSFPQIDQHSATCEQNNEYNPVPHIPLLQPPQHPSMILTTQAHRIHPTRLSHPSETSQPIIPSPTHPADPTHAVRPCPEFPLVAPTLHSISDLRFPLPLWFP